MCWQLAARRCRVLTVVCGLPSLPKSTVTSGAELQLLPISGSPPAPFRSSRMDLDTFCLTSPRDAAYERCRIKARKPGSDDSACDLRSRPPKSCLGRETHYPVTVFFSSSCRMPGSSSLDVGLHPSPTPSPCEHIISIPTPVSSTLHCPVFSHTQLSSAASCSIVYNSLSSIHWRCLQHHCINQI